MALSPVDPRWRAVMSAPPASPKRRLAAMQQGRQRQLRQARKDAARRVREFDAWLRAGCPSGPNVPALPSSHDYKIARGAR